MKNLNFYKFGMMIIVLLFVASCSEDEEEDKTDYGQSFTFTQVDGTPIEGALVELFTSKDDKYSGITPLLTGTTDETGTVYFSLAELNLNGLNFPTDLYLFAEKDYYSNIHDPATFLNFSTDNTNQYHSHNLTLSLIKSLMTPSKWLFKRSILNNVDITSYNAECSKDDFLTSLIGSEQLYLFFNNGTNVCPNSNEGYILYTNFAAFTYHDSENSLSIQDGYQLLSGVVQFTAYAPELFGYNIELEIKDDSLYYNGDISGGTATNVYAPEF